MIYVLLSTACLLLGLLIIHWVHNQHQLDIRVVPGTPPVKAPRISICVPARDEQRNIGACVAALLAQDYPNYKVIVLDDRSSDATPEILRRCAAQDARLTVLHGADLPAGWAGKPHALHQAAAAAGGEWLCFVDADTFLAPEALSACYARAIETGADLFTILTAQVMETFWEKTVQPLVMTALSVGFSPRRVNDPARPDAIANGQFILIRRSVYDAIGGHARIRDQIVEDKAIAEQVKRNGFRLVIADGTRVARTRMYTSLASMWEGWTKNIYLGLSDRPALLLLGAFGAALALIAALFLPAWTLLGLWWWLHAGGLPAALVTAEALAVWGWLLVMRARSLRSMGLSGWWAFTTPLGAAVFAAMMLTSAWKVLSGRGVTWKGRRYNARPK
jgi:chlorobactene glucosyltransferase